MKKLSLILVLSVASGPTLGQGVPVGGMPLQDLTELQELLRQIAVDCCEDAELEASEPSTDASKKGQIEIPSRHAH